MSGGDRTAPLLRLEGLTRRHGGVRALAGIDLTITAGEAVAVLGANGAGKTTLLRILAGLARPTTGRVLVEGRPLEALGARWRARIGVVAHASQLHDRLTVEENLLFAGRLHGLADLRSRTDQLLRTLDLADRAGDEVGTLSRGLQQRAAVARALLHDPDVLLLDEPWSGLDPTAATVLSSLLLVLKRRRRTLLVVTHDVERALSTCGRVLVLRRGRLVLDEPVPAASDPRTEDLTSRCLAALAGTPVGGSEGGVA